MSGKKGGKKAQRPDDAPLEHAATDSSQRRNNGRPWTSSRARVAAFTRHMNMTAEEEREHAKKMAEARWAAHRAARVARGLPPTTPRRPLLSYEELQVWLERVDEEFPNEVFETLEARKRRAMLLARRSIARDELRVAEADEADEK